MKRIREGFARFVRAVNLAGMAACILTVIVVSVNVIARKISGGAVSVPGTNEITAYAMVVMCMLGIPMLQIRNGHIRVSLLTDRLSSKGQRTWMTVIGILETAVLGTLTWTGIWKTQQLIRFHNVSDVLEIPAWPFALVSLIGLAEMTILVLMDTILRAMGQETSGTGESPADE